MQNLYEIIGRKDVEIQEAHAVQRGLLDIIHSITTGKISLDRVVVDLNTNQCMIKPESLQAANDGTQSSE